VLVESVSGEKGAFRVRAGADTVEARRLLLCTGMVDQLLPIDGFRELWGHAIVGCPYCHGWEVKDRPWGYLALAHHAAHYLPFAIQLRGWTRDVVVFTNGELDVPEEGRRQLQAAGVRLETLKLARLVAQEHRLESVELANGTRIPCDVLFAHPPQRQTDVVRALDVALDAEGFVQVDPIRRETSVPGVYAAGDLTTRMQAAVAAAAAGMQAAAAVNFELTLELAARRLAEVGGLEIDQNLVPQVRAGFADRAARVRGASNPARWGTMRSVLLLHGSKPGADFGFLPPARAAFSWARTRERSGVVGIPHREPCMCPALD
jgi:thioredoxin reductase